jgi:hypothetical protein
LPTHEQHGAQEAAGTAPAHWDRPWRRFKDDDAATIAAFAERLMPGAQYINRALAGAPTAAPTKSARFIVFSHAGRLLVGWLIARAACRIGFADERVPGVPPLNNAPT